MRRRQTPCVVAVVALLALGVVAAPAAARLSHRESSVLATVNDVRAAHGLTPLALDVRLARIARRHSADLLRRDVFTHGAFASRVRSSGARGPRFAENLAWGTGRSASPGAVVRAWLRSSSHRRNLLRPGFRRIGLGAATGRFVGHSGATVVTADFAGR